MANTPTKLIVNCETGQQEIVPLTADEIAEMEAAAQASAEARAAAEAEAAAKAAKRLAVLAALAEAAGLEVSEVEAALS